MPDLVFDIGMHHGNDTAFYLANGYRVVGVDASPLLTEQCAARFHREVASGQLTILNEGILDRPGVFTFQRNLQRDEWSTFDPDKNGKPGPWEEIEVRCRSLAALIADYGVPYFIKIDIEGADFQAIATLSSETAPRYISLELNPSDPMIERLIELGYSSFKLVDEETLWNAPPIWEHEIGWRLLRKLSRRFPPFHSAMRALPLRFRMRREWNPTERRSFKGYDFPGQSSGPFGEDAAGDWLSPKAALARFARIRNGYVRAGLSDALWWDVHARRSP